MPIPLSASRSRAVTVCATWLALLGGLPGMLLPSAGSLAQTVPAAGPATAALVEAPPPTDTYRDFTPAEIAALPDTVRLNEVPIQYIFAAQGYEDPEGFEIVHSMKLQALMYDATHSFDAAVRDFQRDLGEAPTGILTVSQIAELTYRNGLVKLGRVELLNTVKTYSFDEAFATAQGTWLAAAEATTLPLNQVHLRCDRARGVCEESATYVAIPGRDSWDMAYLVLNTHDVYEVSRWRRQGIEARRMAGCRQVLLTLTRDGSVTREPGELLTEPDCTLMLGEQTEAPLDLLQRVELVNGTEILRAHYRRLQALAFSHLRPVFRERLEGWQTGAAVAPVPAD